MLVKKNDFSNEVCVDIVHTYINFLMSCGVEMQDGKEISELLRYTLCKLLSLDTKGATSFIELYYSRCSNALKGVLNEHSLFGTNTRVKRGILEACVHCLEMSRKRAEV